MAILQLRSKTFFTLTKRKKRFMLVGAISTAVDFSILFALHAFGITSIGANFISTFFGFLISFFSNRHYTFKAGSGSVHKQIVLYFILTFIGIWLYQPAIIFAVQRFLDGSGLEKWQILFIAKLLATGVTLVWNYLSYSRIVFRHHTGPQ